MRDRVRSLGSYIKALFARKALAAIPSGVPTIVATVQECGVSVQDNVVLDIELNPIRTELDVGFYAKLRLTNRDQGTVARGKFVVLGIDSDWMPPMPPASIALKLSGSGLRGLDGTSFSLEPGQITGAVQVSADKVFALPGEGDAFEYLGALRSFVVTLGLTDGDREPVPIRCECGVSDAL